MCSRRKYEKDTGVSTLHKDPRRKELRPRQQVKGSYYVQTDTIRRPGRGPCARNGGVRWDDHE